MVDMKCHIAMGSMSTLGGGKHNKCAIDCAKLGISIRGRRFENGLGIHCFGTDTRTCSVYGENRAHYRFPGGQEYGRHPGQAQERREIG